MEKLFISLFVVFAFLSLGCEDETQFELDRAAIEDYLDANNIEATYDPQGFYYRIVDEGGEASPNRNSTVEIRYRGELLDGTVFDQSPGTQTVELFMGSLITGWQLGLPLIGRDGEIDLYLPSLYGYGRTGSGPIPPNAPLVFNIELVNFEN